MVSKKFEVGGDNNMNNPWKDINLSDYENHMALDSVQQLQAMNQMMKGQLNQYDIKSAMILGIAGDKAYIRIMYYSDKCG